MIGKKIEIMNFFIKNKKFVYLGIFGIAMGALEAIVVVYLRELYYPKGFNFPLTLISLKFLFIEWIREVSTILMLIMIGVISGRNFREKFSYFLFTFAIWDIFYYVWLKILLNWPSSLFTWDILFLIPVPWIGPVLSPIICSLTMILISMTIINLEENKYKVKIKLYELILVFSGAFIILYTFIYDYSKIIFNEILKFGLKNLINNIEFWNKISQFIPTKFNWLFFIIGEIIILINFIGFIKRIKR